MTYILYNPKAGSGRYNGDLDALEILLQEDTAQVDITTIRDYARFLSGLQEEDTLILAGGDGTLNRFINLTQGLTIPQDILYFPTGSGNDFARELRIATASRPVSVKQYLKDLPTVTADGKTYRFLNGVGYGIDGYCCEVGEAMRNIPGKKINYTTIAIKGLLLHYKPTRAVVKVDGKSRAFRKVWLAPTMHGKFYGGGMMPTPGQQRNTGTLSVMVLHSCSKWKVLRIFPSIFNGTHVRFCKNVEVFTGKEISVLFDRPTALQIDGETIPGVTSYVARA